MSFDELVGPTLLSATGEEVPTSEALRGKKYVMLYFSAHWCPPCRRFTPLLAEAYGAHKEYLEGGGDDAVEVIFVSSDRDESGFDSYRGSMPWLSVPFSSLHGMGIKPKLSGKYGVRGIPTLIVLDGTSGEVVTKNGRGEYLRYLKGD